MSDTSIPDAALTTFLDALDKANERVAAQFPGEGPARQPVHTVYGGAHLFKADAAQKLGSLALRALQEHAPDAVTLASVLDLDRALADRVYLRIIDKLTGDARLQAVSIVFDVAHPVADAGDDRSAGPIMELVVDYWPNHYMALYHAGMAEYMLGQRDLARHSLQDFLKYYHEADGFTSNARTVLSRMSEAEAPPIRRLPEPPG